MYNWFLSNPGGTDREFVSEVMQRLSVSKVTAYSDLAVVKTLMPLLASASRDFHRCRFNEMIMPRLRQRATRRLWNVPLCPMPNTTVLIWRTSRLCLTSLSWCSRSRQRTTPRCLAKAYPEHSAENFGYDCEISCRNTRHRRCGMGRARPGVRCSFP